MRPWESLVRFSHSWTLAPLLKDRDPCMQKEQAQWTPSNLVSLLGPQEMAGHVLRQHVGDQGLVPTSHLVDPFFLVMDLDLPQEQCSCQFFHLQAEVR